MGNKGCYVIKKKVMDKKLKIPVFGRKKSHNLKEKDSYLEFLKKDEG